MHFRILKMIATSGFLTAVNFTKFVIGRGFAPGPAGGAYSATPYPLSGLRGPTSKGGEKKGEGGEGREVRERRKGGRKGKGGEGIRQ